MDNVKQEVRQFYDQIGWKLVGENLYQNARYEDLRPVSREYIHKCHLRVCRHIKHQGLYLLDAGSGPIQYPEYLEYSRDYHCRVCVDISITALKEARGRIGDHGIYVVADVANLPFASEIFDGGISLHTIHHLPENEHLDAYREMYRVLLPESTSVIVNGWPDSRLMRTYEPLVRLSIRMRGMISRLRGQGKTGPQNMLGQMTVSKNNETPDQMKLGSRPSGKSGDKKGARKNQKKGTFTSRHDVAWMKNVVGIEMPIEIMVWRSVNVRFLRNLVFPWNGGRFWLRLLFWLEERYPHFFGENGQYPMIIIQKR